MDYKATLNLPATPFPMKAELPRREPEILTRWEKMDLYGRLRSQSRGRPRFILRSPDSPLDEVAELMGHRGISGVPVTDDNRRVVGLISEKDFLSRMGEAGPKNFMTVIANCLKARGCIALPIRAKKAADIMNLPVLTVHEDTPYSENTDLMARRTINRVPVTDAEGSMIGIITRNDLIRGSSGNTICATTTS